MTGLHHITAMAGPGRRALDSYTRVLGLRLVKRTVNFDDPTSWHLYFGDAAGRPGSLLTLFPCEQAGPGRAGIGGAAEVMLRIPAAAIGFWIHRLLAKGVAPAPHQRRFGESAVAFRDPDGLRLLLVGLPGIEAEPAEGTEQIPAEQAIRGLHGTTLLLREAGPTAAILTDVLGLTEAGREGSLRRFRAEGPLGAVIDLRAAGDFLPGREGAGSIHHIAFRAADRAAARRLRDRLAAVQGIDTGEERERQYFRSHYFREPGGVLFEIATDGPGFGIDEAPAALGRALRLPPGLEGRRAIIEGALPPLD